MDKLIDMHIHTLYSDGEKTPLEIVDLVRSNNISTFSITDHDTVLAVKKLYEDYNEPDLKFIPGIELTGDIDKGRLHILGYGIDVYNENLTNVLVKIRKSSIQRVRLMIEYIDKRFGLRFNEEDLMKIYAREGNIGRPDIAKMCMDYGYVSTADEAFDKYLIEAYEYVRGLTVKLSAKECMELIISSSGIPVLAHPISLKKDYEELSLYIEKLKSYGLGGIEVYHSHHNTDYRNDLLSIADKYNLLVSGGTDYHGEVLKPGLKIGTGYDGNVKIKSLSILNKL